MNEQPHIETAYAALVGTIFNVFTQSFAAAQGDKTAEAAAENTFRNKIARARHLRDRAIASLP